MTEQYITVITGRETARIRVSDVILIEKYRRKLHVVTEERQYEYYEKMENVEGALDHRFYPCLKSCYINLERISYMGEQCICFDNGYILNLGRSNFIKAKQKYNGYLKKMVKKIV